MYNDPDYSTDHRNFKGRLDVGTADHEHVLAFVYKQMINESLGIWADIATSKGVEDSAFGVDQSDLLGFSIKPSTTSPTSCNSWLSMLALLVWTRSGM